MCCYSSHSRTTLLVIRNSDWNSDRILNFFHWHAPRKLEWLCYAYNSSQDQLTRSLQWLHECCDKSDQSLPGRWRSSKHDHQLLRVSRLDHILGRYRATRILTKPLHQLCKRQSRTTITVRCVQLRFQSSWQWCWRFVFYFSAAKWRLALARTELQYKCRHVHSRDNCHFVIRASFSFSNLLLRSEHWIN